MDEKNIKYSPASGSEQKQPESGAALAGEQNTASSASCPSSSSGGCSSGGSSGEPASTGPSSGSFADSAPNLAAPTPSLGKRYSFKLISNAAAIPLYLVMEGILPRSLGPAAYGAFSYATGMFQYLLNFMDAGTSTCLFNALSKRPEEWGLLAFFWRIGLFILVITLLLASLCTLPSVAAEVMPGIPAWVIPLAALWAYGFWGVRILRGVNDALGQTVKSEKARTIAGLLACLALLALHFLNILTLPVLFAHQLVYLLGMCLAFKVIILENWGGWRKWRHAGQRAGQVAGQKNEAEDSAPDAEANPEQGRARAKSPWALAPEQRRAYRKKFITYSLPIFAQALVVALALMADRWLLQIFNGNVEQAFFSISQKVGFACFMFVSAMIPLLMREFAVAHAKEDFTTMGRLLQRFAPILYAVAVYFSAFVSLEAPTVVFIFGGSQFAAAVLAVQIMAIYPVHQGYGQLTQAVFYSSNRTKSLSKITILGCLTGFGASLVILLPTVMGGLGLGAVGLAAKTVIMQILVCNVTLFLCSRFIPLRLGRLLLHQALCLAVFLILAFISSASAEWLPFVFGPSAFGVQDFAGAVLGFCSRGVLYTGLCLLLVWVCPWLWGLNRQDLRFVFEQIKKLVGK